MIPQFFRRSAFLQPPNHQEVRAHGGLIIILTGHRYAVILLALFCSPMESLHAFISNKMHKIEGTMMNECANHNAFKQLRESQEVNQRGLAWTTTIRLVSGI